jgi:hypothetical protein
MWWESGAACNLPLQYPSAAAHRTRTQRTQRKHGTSKRLRRSREILRIFHGEKLNLGVDFWAADRRPAVNLAPAIHIDQWWYHSRWVTKRASLRPAAGNSRPRCRSWLAAHAHGGPGKSGRLPVTSTPDRRVSR